MSNALFLGTADDKAYTPHLKGLFNGLTTYLCFEPYTLITQVKAFCSTRNITKVVSTSVPILSALLAKQGVQNSEPSLDSYQGSVFSDGNLEFVFINPLSQLFTVPYGKFIAERFISKLVAPDAWLEPTPFKWEVATPDNIEAHYENFSSAFAISADIETFKRNLAIRCIGLTSIHIGISGSISTVTIVLPITSDWALSWMRKFLKLPAPKIFQNGKYDNSYLLRYNAYPTAWYWDTAHLFHSWYSELPKDLAFLNAFFLRKVVYWKDMAETNDLLQYYRYNAMDSWATANVWIGQILQMPDWAQRNYLLEFPLVYPCLLAEMTGIERDVDALKEARKEIDRQIDKELGSLNACLGKKAFNPNSPVQVKTLLQVLGCGDITSTNEKDLQKAAYRHPLNALLIGKILAIRGLRKLASTYLRTDDDAKQSGIHAGEGGAKEFNGRVLYALNPHGTDTGRLASKEHHFWCGLQIQNIPRGPEVKQTIRASSGFYLGECDLEQAESRDTAHIAGDAKLISAVTGSKDFHSVNASAFFGVPYSSIYSDELGKTINKGLRDLAKRVNHGANYNMGPDVLVDTMGLGNIWQAKKLLGLSYNEPRQIAEHLLSAFHATYPKLRGPKAPFSEGTYYASAVHSIVTSRKLISRAYHHTAFNLQQCRAEDYIESGDWTRYCFGRPDKSKTSLNSYVAHGPQSLNARTLNEAFMKVFYEIALPNPSTFRLHAQIHDSILFSYKSGYESHAERVRECMEIPVTVRDVSGTYRTFTVPAALKLGKTDKATGEFKRAIYWSETE